MDVRPTPILSASFCWLSPDSALAISNVFATRIL
nr:MAG TPA: hypothetical protein [Caudoviricetes sp.]